MRHVWRCGLLLLATVAPASTARADEPPPVSAGPPNLVDAIQPGPRVEDRLAEIQRRIQSALRYPPLARKRDLDGVVEVAFEIGGDHRARDVAIVASSGHPSLDRAARRAVDDAAPLPPVYGRLVIPVRFDLR